MAEDERRRRGAMPAFSMSAIGTLRTSTVGAGMSALRLKLDVVRARSKVQLALALKVRWNIMAPGVDVRTWEISLDTWPLRSCPGAIEEDGSFGISRVHTAANLRHCPS